MEVGRLRLYRRSFGWTTKGLGVSSCACVSGQDEVDDERAELRTRRLAMAGPTRCLNVEIWQYDDLALGDMFSPLRHGAQARSAVARIAVRSNCTPGGRFLMLSYE